MSRLFLGVSEESILKAGCLEMVVKPIANRKPGTLAWLHIEQGWEPCLRNERDSFFVSPAPRPVHHTAPQLALACGREHTINSLLRFFLIFAFVCIICREIALSFEESRNG
jgi:hypothetical protein